MVLITEDMVRRRAEHNNCEILSLEEVSLHQQDIEKIEHIDKWCRDLKILYLQNNLIPRIGCESLQKLDLTVNFVGQLSSVESLKHNILLRELFLVGNPCTEFEGYRQYVVASLPQLKYLDGKEIGRSERIRARQGLDEVRRRIRQQEQDYLRKRASEKEEAQREGGEAQRGPKRESRSSAKAKNPGFDGRWYTDIKNTIPVPEENNEIQGRDEKEKTSCLSSEDQEREFWEKPCAYTPESRLEAHRHLDEKKKAKERKTVKTPKAPRTLITPNGRVMNVNEPKLDFNLTEDGDNNTIVLDLEVYRHMDTSLMDVDVQPTYARVTVKGKIFQLVLPAEVRPDSSTAKRSQITGHLVLTMPRAQGEIKMTTPRPPKVSQCSHTPEEKTRKRLEVDPSKHSGVDLANIVTRENRAGEQTSFYDNFVDNPDVPPLM
eukprot:XP_013994572.1 PREDICTED: protein tilB homolog isoform X3 [Salmo salar]